MPGVFLDHSSTLLIETGSLSQTQSSLKWLLSLASLLQGSKLCFVRLKLQMDHQAHPTFTWVPGI